MIPTDEPASPSLGRSLHPGEHLAGEGRQPGSNSLAGHGQVLLITLVPPRLCPHYRRVCILPPIQLLVRDTAIRRALTCLPLLPETTLAGEFPLARVY
jgi:hypothetical protein